MTMLQGPHIIFSDIDSQPASPPDPTTTTHCNTALTRCPELDLSVSSTPERVAVQPRTYGILRKNRATKHPVRQVHFDKSPEDETSRPHQAIPVEEPRIITVIHKEQSLARPAGGKRRSDHKRAGSSEDKPWVPQLAETDDGQLPEEARLNSSLALKSELERVTLEEFDGRKALEDKLQSSAHLKNQISAKAAEGVNFPFNQQLYHDLVSVSLSHEQLVSHALRHRAPLAPPVRSLINKPQTPSEAPDLLAFYSPGELLRETPLLLSNQVPISRPRAKPRPAHATFDLYQRQRQWES